MGLSRMGVLQASGQQSMLMASDSGDPVDMLDARTASHKQRTSLPARQKADTADFSRNSEGRMIFNEEDVKKGVPLESCCHTCLCNLPIASFTCLLPVYPSVLMQREGHTE